MESPWVMIQPVFELICIYQNMNVILWVVNKEDIAGAKLFHRAFRFIHDLYALNDGGKIQKSCKQIYLKELAVKLAQTGTHLSVMANYQLSGMINEKTFHFLFFACQTFIATFHQLLLWLFLRSFVMKIIFFCYKSL